MATTPSKLQAKATDLVERIISTAELNFCNGEMSAFQRQTFKAFLTDNVADLISDCKDAAFPND